MTEERNTQDVREVDFIPVTHITQPIKDEKRGDIVDTENPSEQPENLEQTYQRLEVVVLSVHVEDGRNHDHQVFNVRNSM